MREKNWRCKLWEENKEKKKLFTSNVEVIKGSIFNSQGLEMSFLENWFPQKPEGFP